ncbi:hypothetical protein [Methylobacterium iners]|uniref:Uncharacterized protein n=1 Tax=Methylobacterium iners TaxID=418707 RepID=A0ABQ4RRL3_9HYPH|nr:hypothetical protein [Methylobacterium iners]GJD92980.1 hypothetical protein OCOJLMKI_0165 [Methylobacterium iners]
MHRHLAAYAAFNVFYRKQRPSLRCAVRQDQPVPLFVTSQTWAYSGTSTLEEPPSGFVPQAATEASRVTGYYFFEVLEGINPRV